MGAGAKPVANGAAAAAPGVTKDKTKRGSYKPEKWADHPRGKIMAFLQRREDAQRVKKDAEAALAAEAAALEAAIMVPKWQTRDRTCADMHYFPLPSEQGSENIMPWFRESRQPAVVQLCQWTGDFCRGSSDSTIRKFVFVAVLFGVAVVSKVTIQFVPHE